jgi:hypothetical protein
VSVNLTATHLESLNEEIKVEPDWSVEGVICGMDNEKYVSKSKENERKTGKKRVSRGERIVNKILMSDSISAFPEIISYLESNDNPEQRYKNLVLVDSQDKLSALSMISTIRSDVLYKTILRDMRKYFNKDFNMHTTFITTNRNKTGQYFFKCLKEYLALRFDVFGDNVFIENVYTRTLSPSPEYIDLVLFLGCLLYPKYIERSVKQSITSSNAIYGEGGKV